MRAGYKVMDALSLLLFLSVCTAKQMYGEALNGVPGLQYNSLSVEYPAGSGVDESHSSSSASHNRMHCRKLLSEVMGRRILVEEKLNSAESLRSEDSRWIARTLHYLHQAAVHVAPDSTHLAPHGRGIAAAANPDQLSGASFNRITGKLYELKSLAAKHINPVSRPKRSHDGDDADEISYDQGFTFHVDYNGPKTHRPKHH